MPNQTEALLLALLMYGKHPMSPNSPGWVSFTVPADFIAEAEQALANSLLNNQEQRELLLDFKPHFHGCESAEPSLSNLIHRYYGFYFDKPRSTQYAATYIDALLAASASTQEQS